MIEADIEFCVIREKEDRVLKEKYSKVDLEVLHWYILLTLGHLANRNYATPYQGSCSTEALALGCLFHGVYIVGWNTCNDPYQCTSIYQSTCKPFSGGCMVTETCCFLLQVTYCCNI